MRDMNVAPIVHKSNNPSAIAGQKHRLGSWCHLHPTTGNRQQITPGLGTLATTNPLKNQRRKCTRGPWYRLGKRSGGFHRGTVLNAVGSCCRLFAKELWLRQLATVGNWTASGANLAGLALKVLEPIKRAHRQLSAMALLA